MLTSVVLISSLIFTSSVICEKEPYCEPEDSRCVTEIGIKVFADFVRGRPGIEPSDPIHEDEIEAHLPKIWYKFTDILFSGLKNCHLDYLKISKDQKYQGLIRCPQLSMDSEYEVKGEVGTLFVEGKGTCKVNFYDYNITFNGEYEMKNGADNKIHVYLKNQKLDTNTGKAEYEYRNLFNGDKKKSDAAHKWANENWRLVHEPTRLPTTQVFMSKYSNNINEYLSKMSLEELYALV